LHISNYLYPFLGGLNHIQTIFLKHQTKYQYLDSLVTGNFTKEEREEINSRINEFSLEEKQTQSRLYKVEFQLIETMEKTLSIDSFKESIVKFLI